MMVQRSLKQPVFLLAALVLLLGLVGCTPTAAAPTATLATSMAPPEPTMEMAPASPTTEIVATATVLPTAAATMEATLEPTMEAETTPEASGGSEMAYDRVFFKIIEQRAPRNIIIGTMSLTLMEGEGMGTATVYPNSRSFAGDTGTVTITFQEGPPQGDKQSYTATVEIDFEDAPDYTATGTFYTVAGKLFTEQPMMLSSNGAQAGKLILSENDVENDGD